jgi:ankyrin repeat protein
MKLSTQLATRLGIKQLGKDLRTLDAAMLQAIATGQLSLVESLLDISGISMSGDRKLLPAAIHSSDVDIARILLSRGADPNTIDPGVDRSVLWVAASNDRVEIVKLLREARGIDVEYSGESSDGETPFLSAVRHGCLASVKALLNVANTTAKDSATGNGALLLAVEAGDDKGTQLLDVLLPRSEIDTTGALHRAVLYSRPLMVQNLLTASRRVTVLSLNIA